MHTHRQNRYSNKFTRSHPAYSRRAQILDERPIQDAKTGFIQHPASFPIKVKPKKFWKKVESSDTEGSRIGLMFDSQDYIKPGTYVEITIPLSDKTEQFTAKVVLVKQCGEYYEIGLWLLHQEDASRARIVEQICHIEVYMQEKKYRDGPYNLNPDRVAREWITKYASEVPTL